MAKKNLENYRVDIECTERDKLCKTCKFSRANIVPSNDNVDMVISDAERPNDMAK